jgi:hypothetical protein
VVAVNKDAAANKEAAAVSKGKNNPSSLDSRAAGGDSAASVSAHAQHD